MNKKSMLWIVLDLIFLIVFNTVFFVVGGLSHPASVWISYGFIHFAYLMVLATHLLTRKSSSSFIFGLSIYSISSTYFLFEFVVGVFFIFLKSESYKASLVVQVILAGIYAIILLSHLIANEYTADSIEKHESEVAYIKDAASKIKLLIGKIDDKKVNKKIEKVYDLLHSSPTKSIEAVKSLENEIRNKSSELEDAVNSGNKELVNTLSDEIIHIAEERNSKIRKAN